MSNLQFTSVTATMSGLSVASLDFNSLNLLDKESALVYQHFRDLHIVTVPLRLSFQGQVHWEQPEIKKLVYLFLSLFTALWVVSM